MSCPPEALPHVEAALYAQAKQLLDEEVATLGAVRTGYHAVVVRLGHELERADPTVDVAGILQDVALRVAADRG